MKLNDLIVETSDIRAKVDGIRSEISITAVIKVTENGLSIIPEDPKERLTLAELTSLSAMAFFYAGFANAGIMPDKEEVVRKGMQLYGVLKRELRGDYDGKK